jgi:hypothetical protein
MDDALDGPVLPPCVTHAKVPQWISNYAEEAINSQLSFFNSQLSILNTQVKILHFKISAFIFKLRTNFHV